MSRLARVRTSCVVFGCGGPRLIALTEFVRQLSANGLEPFASDAELHAAVFPPPRSSERQEVTQRPDGSTEYDFSDETVEGDLVRPDGEMVGVRARSAGDAITNVQVQGVDEGDIV